MRLSCREVNEQMTPMPMRIEMESSTVCSGVLPSQSASGASTHSRARGSLLTNGEKVYEPSSVMVEFMLAQARTICDTV